jgi:hypothetical protein
VVGILEYRILVRDTSELPSPILPRDSSSWLCSQAGLAAVQTQFAQQFFNDARCQLEALPPPSFLDCRELTTGSCSCWGWSEGRRRHGPAVAGWASGCAVHAARQRLEVPTPVNQSGCASVCVCGGVCVPVPPHVCLSLSPSASLSQSLSPSASLSQSLPLPPSLSLCMCVSLCVCVSL